MLRAAFLAIAVFVALARSVGFAQQSGDRIVVTAHSAQFRGETLTGTIARGAVEVVEAVSNDSLWVAVHCDDRFLKGYVNRADVVPLSRAVSIFDEEVARRPTAEAYTIRGTIWSEKGEQDIAIRDYNKALQLDSTYHAAYLNRGAAWHCKKQYDNAIKDYNEAIRLYPRFTMAYTNRGIAWEAKGKYDNAISDYNEAIRLDPNYAGAYTNRGITWSDKNECSKAIADFDEAIRLDPQGTDSWNARAWVYATCPDPKFRDGKKAVEDATKACELRGRNEPKSLGNLAAVYAETGDFDNAIKWQEKAIELSSATSKSELRSRLDLYKAHKPYRLAPKR